MPDVTKPRFHHRSLPGKTTSEELVRQLNTALRRLENTISGHIGPRVDGRVTLREFDYDIGRLVDVVGSSEVEVLLLPGEGAKLSADVTIPSTMAVRCLNGVFDLNGNTLTINGEFRSVGQAFEDTTGALPDVAFGVGAVTEVFPEWFGAVGDGSTDDYKPLRAAQLAAGGSGAPKVPVRLKARDYAYGTTLDFAYGNMRMFGDARGSSELVFTGSGAAITITADNRVYFEDFNLRDNSSGSATHGMVFGRSSSSTAEEMEVRRVQVQDFTSGNGIYLRNSELHYFNGVRVRNCSKGFVVDASLQTASGLSSWNTFINCRATSNSGAGWDIDEAGSNKFLNCEAIHNSGSQQFILGGSSRACMVEGLDIEVSTGGTIGLQVAGTAHIIVAPNAYNLSTGVKFTTASNCQLIGGTFSTVTTNVELTSGASDNRIQGVSRSGITDNGENTDVTHPGKSPAVQRLAAWVTHTDQNPTLGVLPGNCFVLNAFIEVNQAGFDSSGTDTISIGNDSNNTSITNAIDVSSTGLKSPTVSQGFKLNQQTVKAYYVNGGSEPTQGKALCIVEFCKVPDRP